MTEEIIYDYKLSGTIKGRADIAEKAIRLCARKYGLDISFLDFVEGAARGNRTYFLIEATSNSEERVKGFEKELTKL